MNNQEYFEEVQYHANHILKTDSKVFTDNLSGSCKFNIRFNDRNFKILDHLLLRETKYTGSEMANGKPLEYTGRWIYATVTHIFKGPIYGLMDGWVIMSIVPVISGNYLKGENKE